MGQSIINNRYEVLRKLGQGSLGAVYLVKDYLQGEQEIALRSIHKTLINYDLLNHFRREFDTLARLKHPHLARVFDFGFNRVDESYLITMEYVGRQSLRDEQTEPERDDVLDMVVTICRTLQFIHSRNILHGNVKPANIMVGKGHLTLTDCGLARLAGTDELQKRLLSTWIGPEMVRGHQDERTDLFATGLTFYQLLTGVNFYQDVPAASIIDLVQNQPEFTAYLDRMLEKIPGQALQSLIAKMLAYQPDDRFHSALEVIQTINHLLHKNYDLETAQTREAYVLGINFVTREKEFTSLVQALDAGPTLVVKGISGSGKSR
ncbi:serine/threonine protein kinase, partial [candidate division CSSED10-310 bacterium]